MIQNGFDAIVNLRQGKTSPGNVASQEEVTLLNIMDDTGTYTGAGRQSKTELEKNRIDPTKTNEYVSDRSDVNYISRNALEFGDDIGYNEEWEKKNVTATGIQYMHTPAGKTCTQQWNKLALLNYFSIVYQM